MAATSRGPFRIGIAGAAGVLAEELLRTLVTREFPVARLRLFESDDRLGSDMGFGSSILPMETLSDETLESLDIIVFAGPASVTEEWGAQAAESGLAVLDFSTPPRPGTVRVSQLGGRVPAGAPVQVPSATAAILALVIAPLQQAGFRIERLRVAASLSLSEAGREGIEALSGETRQLLAMETPEANARYRGRLAFNVVPGAQMPGAADPEKRAADELAELIGVERARVSVMSSFVPVFYGNTYAVELETTPRLDPAELGDLLEAAGRVEICDEGGDRLLPPLASEFVGREEFGVGRIRATGTGIQFWVAADNVRVVADNGIRLLEQLLGLETTEN
ncbi:MAG: hypothetical protein KIT79_05955 [Deltaproteobacteria bacterium]|nr:hypothetical protein [Deltaproteobacteria bacterium]